MEHNSLIKIEKAIDNEWFTFNAVRQANGKLYVHVNYKKYSPKVKKESLKVLESFDEPLYAFAHGKKHWKFLKSLGFKFTGAMVDCAHPGKEDLLFGEVWWVKDGVENFAINTYKKMGEMVLPFDMIDGYGKLEEIEEALLEMEQAKWQTQHHFSDGVYTRETFVPRGTVLTGWRHRQETVSILAAGAISVVAVDKQGRAIKLGLMMAPQVVVTKPGMKKIGYAHEDTVFINSFSLEGIPKKYHNKESIDIIESYIFEKEEEQCLELSQPLLSLVQ